MFSTILGQESVIAALQQSLRTAHLAQTYLFAGEHQIGKTKTANEFAKALLCENRPEQSDDSCDHCSACRLIDTGTHPDVRSAAPSGPSRVLRMAQFWPRDNVKEHPADRALLRDLHFAPVSGRKRIFIVEAAEAMNEDTANSLLKVLEEPPPYVIFVLTAVSTQAVLPTILSRAQTLRFRPVPEPLIKAELLRRKLPEARAAFLSAYAQGRPGIAFRASESKTVMDARDEVLATAADSSSGKSVIAAFKIADDLRKSSAHLGDLLGEGEEQSARTLLTGACDLLLFWYRDLLIRCVGDGHGVVLNSDRLETIDGAAKRYSETELEHAIELIRDTRRYIYRNANAQVATESLMIKLLGLGNHVRGAA